MGACMTMPIATQRWIHTVSLHLDCTIANSDPTPSVAAFDHAISHSDELALTRLGVRLQLSREEVLVVWCLVASQLVPQIGTRFEGLSGSVEVSTGAIAAVCYGERPARAISELGMDSKLARYGLVESADDPRGPVASWSRRTIRATDRLLALALETATPSLDSSLTFASLGEPMPIDQLAIDNGTIERVRSMMATRACTVVIAGRPGLGRRTLLVSVAHELGVRPLQIGCAWLSKDPSILRTQLRQLARECALLDRVPLLIQLDALSPDALDLVDSELVAATTVALATSSLSRPTVRWKRPPTFIELEEPTSELRAAFWLRALGQGAESDGEHLTTTYPMAPALIQRAANAAKASCPGELTPEAIIGGIRSVISDRLGHLATRVSVTQSWGDLVLPQDQVNAIVELLARIRERRTVYEKWGFAKKVGKGLGVSALFSGPPGTGKTMVAALIAKDLGLELYQVDLAKIVSKYVGETEKQLGELFDAAEAGHAVLLFDEADAMFGKRTDVKSSNDRYANLETNYLLQRLESFTGICLLTSNHEGNIDAAFRRRLALHVRFELPDSTERAALWQTLLTGDAPVAGTIAFDSLAHRFVMSGGHIRNAALRAAFHAADENSPITMGHLERAATLEYEALGKIAA